MIKLQEIRVIDQYIKIFAEDEIPFVLKKLNIKKEEVIGAIVAVFPKLKNGQHGIENMRVKDEKGKFYIFLEKEDEFVLVRSVKTISYQVDGLNVNETN